MNVYYSWAIYIVYQITGNFTWMEVSRENIKELCAIAIERNTELWLEIDGETQLPAVIDAICPNECSNNGNCSLGNPAKLPYFFTSSCPVVVLWYSTDCQLMWVCGCVFVSNIYQYAKMFDVGIQLFFVCSHSFSYIPEPTCTKRS